jgi:hypothetical protein
MFEGNPINSLDQPDFALFCLSLVLGGGVGWIRQRFLKEWKLANWVIFKINRIWQRGADEVPQTEGIIVSHLLGIWAVGIIGYLLDNFLNGLLVGLSLFIIRQLVFWGLGFYPKTKMLSLEHSVVDRVIRMWLSVAVGGAALVFSILPRIDALTQVTVLTALWFVVVMFKWVRVLQSSRRRLNDILLAFLYLCALEILPFIVLMNLILYPINT